MPEIVRSLRAFYALLLVSGVATPLPTLGRSLYYENFETSPYINSGAGTRWNVYRGDGSQVLGPGPSANPYYSNWLPNGGINGTGYIFTQQQPNAVATSYLLHVNPQQGLQFSASDLGFQSLSLKWDEGRSSMETVARRVAMLIDGSWYVSERTDLVSGNAQRMDLINTSWYRLQASLGSGASLSVDATSSLRFHELVASSGTITSFGFYSELPASEGVTRTIRYDNLHLTTGIEWRGGSGVWSATEADRWQLGGLDPNLTGLWTQNEVAVFGERQSGQAVGTVTVKSNVTTRALEFYENANGARLLGDTGLNADTSPMRAILINNDYAFRSVYVAPDVNVTLGGDSATGLRLYRSGSALHLYGGGQLTLAQNSMVRSEMGSDVILNDGTTVLVQTGAAFNTSRDLYLGSGLSTMDGSSGDATLILDGGTTITRTGNVGGDLTLGGLTGHATLHIKQQGQLTTHASSPNGVVLQGNSTIRLESGGTLSTRQLRVSSDFTGTAQILLDGGVLHMNNSPASGQNYFLNHDSVTLQASTGGAIFHTGGREMILRNALLHAASGAETDGGLIVRGGGTLNFDLPATASSTFNGAVRVENSTLKISRFEALGLSSNAASNLVLDGGTLFVTGSGIASNRELTVTSNGGTYRSAGSSRIHGKLVGAANSTLKIEGSSWLSGDSRSSFHGNIEVVYGEFLVRRAASLGSTTGGVLVRNGATFSIDHNGTGGGGNNTSDNQYADALVLEQQATLATRGRASDGAGTDTIYSGQITLNGPGASTFRVANTNAASLSNPDDIPDLVITGAILGNGSLTKTGAGRMILSHANSYAGKTLVQQGMLALRGNASVSSSNLEVAQDAHLDFSETTQRYQLQHQSLSGLGSIHGPLSFGNQAELRAGLTQGSVAGDSIGKLNFASAIQLAQGSNTVFQIASSAQYDQLNFQAQLEVLNGATFTVEWLNFEGVLGDSFDLMNWNSAQWDSSYQQQLLTHLILPTFSNASLGWDTSDFLSQGILRINAVPEPSKALLASAGMLSLGLIRRRRHSPKA